MKERLDVLLVRNGFFDSREKAKRTIMAGRVYVNGQKEDKAGMKFDADSEIEVRGQALRYVSRGGLKLEKAIDTFALDLRGKICMDVGASTGGFTDCMLQNGASKVYSIDVGHGQLDWKLREDERVVCMERFNARNLTADDLPQTPQFCSIDVSFISLRLILEPVKNVLSGDGQIAALIKPQFEAGREKIGRKGVVRDPKVHEEVIRTVLEFAASIGLAAAGLTFSPVTGPEGNIEYLAYLRKEAQDPAQAQAQQDAKPLSDPAAAGGTDDGADKKAVSVAASQAAASHKIDIAGVVRLAHETLAGH